MKAFNTILPVFPNEAGNGENMKISGRNCLIEENVWFFRCLKLFGMFPLSCDEKEKMIFQWFSRVTLYTLFMLTMYLTNSGAIIMIVVRTIWKEKIGFVDASYACGYIFSNILILTPVISFFEVKKFASFINDWADFQALFEETTKNELKPVKRRNVIVLLVFNVTIITSIFLGTSEKVDLVYAKYNMDKSFHNFAMVGVFLSSWIVSSYALLWVSCNRAIKRAASLTIMNIENLKWVDEPCLNKYMNLWLHLSELCQSLGNSLCCSYIYLSATMFVVSLPAVYNGAIAVIDGDFLQLIVSFTSLTYISMLAEMCHQSTHAVGGGFQSRLTRLLLSGRATNGEKELRAFIQTVASCIQKISLAGYFQLDRSINVPLYSSIITYIVIIIQFQPMNG